MQHQESFAASLTAPEAGLIQVTLPTDQESMAATDCMRHAYEKSWTHFRPDPYICCGINFGPNAHSG